MRGRKHIRKTSMLIVLSKDCPLAKAAQNLPGFDIIMVKNLNAELLAPGTHAGRLTMWTEDAVKMLEKENLFA